VKKNRSPRSPRFACCAARSQVREGSRWIEQLVDRQRRAAALRGGESDGSDGSDGDGDGNGCGEHGGGETGSRWSVDSLRSSVGVGVGGLRRFSAFKAEVKPRGSASRHAHTATCAVFIFEVCSRVFFLFLSFFFARALAL
jgi:hypothetical protein